MTSSPRVFFFFFFLFWWPDGLGALRRIDDPVCHGMLQYLRIADGRGGGATGNQRFAPINSWPDKVKLG